MSEQPWKYTVGQIVAQREILAQVKKRSPPGLSLYLVLYLGCDCGHRAELQEQSLTKMVKMESPGKCPHCRRNDAIQTKKEKAATPAPAESWPSWPVPPMLKG